MSDLKDELAVAKEAAAESSRIALGYFGESFDVARKSDGSWVTEADKAVETRVRQVLSDAFPDHNILGEEEGLQRAGGGDPYRSAPTWIVDPIDGTNNFMLGLPIWATLIALQTNTKNVLGVCSAPALGELYEASAGGGAYFNGTPISVNDKDDLSAAFIAFGSAHSFYESGLSGFFEALVTRTWRDRGLGDFWGHMLVARGIVDVMIEADLSLWDVAALQPIVEEAGGKLTRLKGDPFVDRGSCISSNGRLHDQLLALREQHSPDWVETRLGRGHGDNRQISQPSEDLE